MSSVRVPVYELSDGQVSEVIRTAELNARSATGDGQHQVRVFWFYLAIALQDELELRQLPAADRGDSW